jgi:hypothetical protein
MAVSNVDWIKGSEESRCFVGIVITEAQGI